MEACGNGVVDSGEECDDANGMDNDGCNNDCTASFNFVFVTSTLQTANLGGLAGADQLCNDRATAAGLPGAYVAWLSTSTVNAPDRLAGARGWVRPDGMPFADRPIDTLEKPWYPPMLDEFGNIISNPEDSVATATLSDGTYWIGLGACSEWTDDTTGSTGAGVPAAGTATWTSYISRACSAMGRLYCFGVSRSQPLSLPPATGRIAFTTAAPFPVAGGIAVADAQCQSEADGAGLPAGTYRALIATNAASAISRFDVLPGTPPWIRPDGVRVTDTAAGLATLPLVAPIAIRPDGVTYSNRTAWTGAPSVDVVGTNTCDDWTVTTGQGQYGATARVFETFFRWGQGTDCTFASAHLYCLQE